MAKKKKSGGGKAEWVAGEAMGAIVWFDATNVLIRGVFGATETVGGTLEAAIDGSAAGVPRAEPATIRVADPSTRDDIKKHHGDRFTIEVAPTPELTQVMQMLLSMSK